jgi:signal transduction histidine kinase
MNSKTSVNILLVDDQPAKLLSYETILGSLQENLIRANSGKEALELLLKNEIAVVLVDVCMPELDGFELASMIRSHPRFQKTAIILVSGVLVEDVYRLKGYDSGAVDYISVPIVPEILRAKVSVFADLYRKTEELQRLNQELELRVRQRTAEIESAATLLRQNEERLRLVLTAASIQGWSWDTQKDEFTWVGPPAESRDGIQSLSEFLDLVHPSDRAGVRSAFDLALRGQPEYYAEFRTQVGGEEQWWLGRGTVIRDSSGHPLSIAGININISERKRAEQERAVLLKNEEEARREAERANQLKDEFMAILSHELRTPLNAITGWAHMLRDGGLDPGTQHKAVETINRNAMLQARLISDLLDVSRIVSGKLRLDIKSVDLHSVVQAAVDAIRPTAEAKNVHLQAALGTDLQSLTGDPGRLQQVISNLLSNAVKFAPPNGDVLIRLQNKGSQVELTIQDDGPGIRKDFLPHLFERFRQGDASTTRAHQGLGLGLAIVRHLVEMHGGSVSATNREDRSGAIFQVRLPMLSGVAGAGTNGAAKRAAVSLPDAPIESSASPLKNTRILVVDDEADGREVVAVVLERYGAEVMVAASAGQALALLERERPDVLVADIEMPGEDGYSLIRKIRNLAPNRGGKTPAVALTAHASTSDRLRLLEAGFNRHVPKPVQPLDLMGIIAKLARLSSEGVLKVAPASSNT